MFSDQIEILDVQVLFAVGLTTTLSDLLYLIFCSVAFVL